MHLLLNMLGFFELIVGVYGNIEMAGNFKECVIGTKLNMLLFDNDCYRDTDQDENKFDDIFSIGVQYHPAFVFSKHNFILETKGFECKLLIHKYRYSKDFLLNKYIQKEIVRVQLSKSECLTMAVEKECGKYNEKRKLKCNKNNECSYVEDVIDEFPFYFGTVVKHFYECHISERIVQAQNFNSSIFHNSKAPCYAEDEVCFFDESTVVWNKNDIRQCQFERLLELPFLQIKLFSKSSIFYTENQEYLFRLKKKESHCGIDFFLTTEGLYLAFYNKDRNLRRTLLDMQISKFNINHFLDKDRNDLILAENDFQKFLVYKLTMNLACSMLINTIQANINNDDTFLVLNYPGRQDITVYINNGQAFLPSCVNISTIYVTNSTYNDKCEKDVKIGYSKENSSRIQQGYLRTNNIITQFSSKRDNCLKFERSIVVSIDSGKKFSIIKRNETRIEVKDFNVQTTELRIGSGNLVHLYNHHDYLLNGSDFYEKMNEFFEPSETISLVDKSSSNYFPNEKSITSQDPFTGIFQIMQNGLSYTKRYFVSLFICICFGLLVVFFLKKTVSYIFNNYQKLFKTKWLSRENSIESLKLDTIRQHFLLED